LTAEFVTRLPDWTRGQQQDHIVRSTRSSWSAAPWMPAAEAVS